MSQDEYTITHMAENQVTAPAEDLPEISVLPNYLKEWLALEEDLKVLSAATRAVSS